MTWAPAGVRTRIRATLARTLPRPCWRCGEVINPGDQWDVGHLVDRAAGGGNEWSNLAPEHAGPCNRSAGARAGNLARAGRIARRRRW